MLLDILQALRTHLFMDIATWGLVIPAIAQIESWVCTQKYVGKQILCLGESFDIPRLRRTTFLL